MDNNLNDTLNSLRNNSSSSGNTYNINYYYNYNTNPLSSDNNLRINDRVVAKWDRGRHSVYNGWYHGKIIGINPENNYRILFDDGFTDNDVPIENIRFISRNESVQQNNTTDNNNVNSNSSNVTSNSSNINSNINSNTNSNINSVNTNINTNIPPTETSSNSFSTISNSNINRIYSPIHRRSSTLFTGSNSNYRNRTSNENPLNLSQRTNFSENTTSGENYIQPENTNELSTGSIGIINNMVNSEDNSRYDNSAVDNNISDNNTINTEVNTTDNDFNTIYEESINSITEQLEETINQIYQNINSSSELNNNFQAILEISRVGANSNGVTLAQLNISSQLISVNPSNISEYEEERCAVCNDDFTVNEVIRKLNTCPHYFHYNCIDTWFINNSTCPICRRDINDYSPTRISYNINRDDNDSNIVDTDSNIVDTDSNIVDENNIFQELVEDPIDEPYDEQYDDEQYGEQYGEQYDDDPYDGPVE
jgi:hypothetical protein